MIADDGVTPILMDFGSTIKARIKIDTRSQALLQQVLFQDPYSCRVVSSSVGIGYRRGAEHYGIQGARAV